MSVLLSNTKIINLSRNLCFLVFFLEKIKEITYLLLSDNFVCKVDKAPEGR